MLRFIPLRGVRAPKNVEHSWRRENVIKGMKPSCRVLLYLENKQQIIPNNVETQYTCIRNIQVP